MNVQGAAVEQELGRAIMSEVPRRVEHRHGGRGRPRCGHGRPRRAGHRAPARGRARGRGRPCPSRPAASSRTPGPRRTGTGRRPRRSPLAAWTEPRTLLIGLFVLCMAFTEGTGNDWLSLGGHRRLPHGGRPRHPHVRRLPGRDDHRPLVRPRASSTAYGRVPVLRTCAAIALAGAAADRGLGRVLPAAVGGAIAARARARRWASRSASAPRPTTPGTRPAG